MRKLKKVTNLNEKHRCCSIWNMYWYSMKMNRKKQVFNEVDYDGYK